jgi:glycosyltransferase involved in cell wall biosynthesis
MFGWELPPYNSGGLGTATLGLTEGLAPLGVNIDLVLPKVFGPYPYDHMRVLDASEYTNLDTLQHQLKLTEIEKRLLAQALAYGSQISVDEKKRIKIKHSAGGMPISPDVQASWYAYQAAAIANENEGYDIIHAHDWMTYYCGIAARRVSQIKGKPVPYVAHIHATEWDRCSDFGDPHITAIEREGLRAADRVIAVSHYTKQVVHKQYQIPLNRISVVHNGIPSNKQPERYDLHELKKHHKIVLFLGRITMQKGPEYFIQLAKAVTDRDPSVRFIMVGSGDMETRCIELSARTGLTGKVLFSSFLRGKDVDRAYQLADLFVMPSVSEPFGIVALEALQNGTPALVSKQSGCAEVSDNIIKVDFWDIPKMAEETLHVLHSHDHAQHLIHHGQQDLNHLTWDHSAAALKSVYDDVIERFRAQQLQPAFVTAD